MCTSKPLTFSAIVSPYLIKYATDRKIYQPENVRLLLSTYLELSVCVYLKIYWFNSLL
jgi:hypothetical protein